MISFFFDEKNFYQTHPQKFPIFQKTQNHKICYLEAESFDVFLYDRYSEIILDSPHGVIRQAVPAQIAQELNIIELHDLSGFIHQNENGQTTLIFVQGDIEHPDQTWTMPIDSQNAQDVFDTRSAHVAKFKLHEANYADTKWFVLDGVFNKTPTILAFSDNPQPVQAIPAWVATRPQPKHFSLIDFLKYRPHKMAARPLPHLRP